MEEWALPTILPTAQRVLFSFFSPKMLFFKSGVISFRLESVLLKQNFSPDVCMGDIWVQITNKSRRRYILFVLLPLDLN